MKLPAPALVLCGLAAAAANAQNPFPGGPRSSSTQANGGGVPAAVGGGNVRNHGHLGNDGVFIWDDGWGNRIIEREVVHEVVREVPAPPSEPPPPPRKPYVIGASYASLPGGCMKMVEAGGTFFYCSGEWYRQVGGGYRAVKEP